MEFLGVHLLAVLILSAVTFVFGAFWYGTCFGKSWMKLAKPKAPQETQKELIMAVGFINTIITTFFVAFFVNMLSITHWMHGLATGLLLAIGFVGSVMLSDVIWGERPFELYLIHFGYRVITFGLTGALITLF